MISDPFAVLLLIYQNASATNASNYQESLEATNMINWNLILLYTVLSLSTAGCMFNIIVTIYLKLNTYSLGKMIINLCIHDLFFAWSFTMITASWIENKIILETLGVISIVSWSGSVGWVCCFAHALYLSVVNQEQESLNLVYKKYCIIIGLITIITGVATIIFDVFLDDTVNLSALFHAILGITILSISFIFCLVFLWSSTQETTSERNGYPLRASTLSTNTDAL